MAQRDNQAAVEKEEIVNNAESTEAPISPITDKFENPEREKIESGNQEVKAKKVRNRKSKPSGSGTPGGTIDTPIENSKEGEDSGAKKGRRRRKKKISADKSSDQSGDLKDLKSPPAGVEPTNGEVKQTLKPKPKMKDASTQCDTTDFENNKASKPANPRYEANDKRRFSEAENFAKLIHKYCLEANFTETGQNYMFCQANFFEATKLKPLYDKFLVTCLKGACQVERERIRAKLFLVRSLRPNVSFKAGIVSGVAGSGKSTLIRRLTEGKTKAVTVLANPRLKETDFKGCARTFTLQDALLSVVPMQADVIVVDEYTLAESAELLLLQRKMKASFLLLVGDVAQGTATSASSLEYLCLPTVYSSQVSHRMGKATAELCMKHGQKFIPKGGDDRVENGDYEGETESTEKNLAFTQETVDDLKECNIDCSLVIDAQGKEYNSVTLFIRNEDREAAADSHARAVALTRHKRLLVIRAEREIAQAFLIGELSSKPVSNAHKYHNEKFTHEDPSRGATE